MKIEVIEKKSSSKYEFPCLMTYTNPESGWYGRIVYATHKEGNHINVIFIGEVNQNKVYKDYLEPLTGKVVLEND